MNRRPNRNHDGKLLKCSRLSVYIWHSVHCGITDGYCSVFEEANFGRLFVLGYIINSLTLFTSMHVDDKNTTLDIKHALFHAD